MDDLDANQDDGDDGAELFAFLADDKPLVDEIIAAVRGMVRGRNLAPSGLHYLGAALHALNRPPCTTPGVELGVSLSYRFGDEMNYIGLHIGESSFRLDAGGSVYTPDVGSDSFSNTVLEVEPSGFRQSEDSFTLSGWMEKFREACKDSRWDLSFEWLGDGEGVDWGDEISSLSCWRRLGIGRRAE